MQKSHIIEITSGVNAAIYSAISDAIGKAPAPIQQTLQFLYLGYQCQQQYSLAIFRLLVHIKSEKKKRVNEIPFPTTCITNTDAIKTGEIMCSGRIVFSVYIIMSFDFPFVRLLEVR
jgi:hypothetical protein